MKRNQLMAAFALSIVLIGVGISNQATAESKPNTLKVFIQRVCVPAPFGEIRRNDFRGINLNKTQQQKIRVAYNKFMEQVVQNSGSNKCYNEDEGVISKDFLGFYTAYEATVRQTLTPRQLKQWDKNLDAILGRNKS